MRFIGSKERLLPFIDNAFDRHVGRRRGTVGDLFSGTASVARHLKRRGFQVVANDNLHFCYVLAHVAVVLNEEPRFEVLVELMKLRESRRQGLLDSNYDVVLAFLNQLEGEDGFIYREYSPAGTRDSKNQRRYYTDSNARRIDAIRNRVVEWRTAGVLSEGEACLLTADLMRAANRVANIAGTYGCFIKHWDPRAKRRLRLERSIITPGQFRNEAHCLDAHKVARSRSFDVVYLDPPYTWRHYGAYYHLLETIARGDLPRVSGKTGLRDWEDSKSRYCDRSDASSALRELVSLVNCAHLFLSYNSDGLISHDDIVDILSSRGKLDYEEVTYRRYRSNNGGTMRPSVRERLYHVRIA